MEKSKILSADILDILFDGRNKNYGAYELRKTYEKRFRNSLIGMFSVCLLMVAATLLASSHKKEKQSLVVTDYQLQNIQEPEKPPVETPPPPKVEPPKMEMSQYTTPKIVKDEEVKPEEEIKEIEKLADTKIGKIDQEGLKDDGVIAPPVEKSTGVTEAPKTEKDIDKEFTTVQIEARFPGGAGEWNKFLQRNLNSALPGDNGAPAGDYTVIVSFLVDRQGNISDVQALNDPGYGTKMEAIRVIKKGPNWIPAIQNGRNVVYRQRQQITFRISE